MMKTIETQRAGSPRETSVSERNSPDNTASNVLWFIGGILGSAVFVAIAVCVFYPTLKRKWRDPRAPGSENVPGSDQQIHHDKERENSVIGEEVLEDEEISEDNIIPFSQVWDPEPFNQAMMNSSEAQQVLMDEVLEHAGTEGVEDSK